MSQRRLRFVSGKEFMEKEAEFQWVIPPFVAVGSNMMLYGRQGLGKSTLMMQLVHCFGTGEPWMGFPVLKTGKVLYLGLDMSDSETRKLLERCREEGLSVEENLILPRPLPGADDLEFNIFDEEAFGDLKEICDEEQPVAVIVDALQDSFEVPLTNYDVNQIGRMVLKRFREAIGDAVLIFLNHKRKTGGIRPGKGGEEADDDDAYMGATVWEAKVAASLMLGYSTKTRRKFLKVKKTRLAKPATHLVFLDDMGEGFYSVQQNAGQLLTMWPHCIADKEEREKAVLRCRSMMDVFRNVADLSGESVDAVKKAYQRALAGGAHFEWTSMFKAAKVKS